MKPICISINDRNYLVQEVSHNSQRVVLRIDTTDIDNVTTHAELFKQYDDNWAYVIEERSKVWCRQSTINDTQAVNQEEALEDLLYHIRSCNYLAQGVTL